MQEDFWILVLIGFAAQLVDGALGMAYGLTASSLLLATGLSPLQVSATVHLAEVFTTAASAVSHHRFGNVDGQLFRRLVLPGCLGAFAGAYLLSSLPGERLRPWVAGYILLMGVIVFAKAFTEAPPLRVAEKVRSLGFFGALMDSLGGGGWGPIVTSTLLARGNEVRFTVGTVNAVEFFVTLTASAVFLVSVGLGLWKLVLPLALGGFFAAPLAAYICKHVPHKMLLVLVGLVIIAVSMRNLLRALA